MRTAYFDCFSGVSGDMILAAFLDLGLDFDYLKNEIAKLKLSGYKLEKRKVVKGGFSATKFEVILSLKHASHKRIPFSEIKSIIVKSRLKPAVKILSIKIFENIRDAESQVHGIKKEKVHFHEIGDTDSLIDVVGFAIAFDYFKIGNAYASAVNVGSGSVKTAHGLLPVPAPATAILLKGIPIHSGKDRYELATPTGAAILKTVCSEFASIPLMRIEKTGVSAGTFDTKEQPNILRIFLSKSVGGSFCQSDTVVMVETNIDDMNLSGSEHIMERIFKAGALDVCFMPVYMKKSRMGILLSVITYKEHLEHILKVIFEETTTFGIRTYDVLRYKLPRQTIKTKTKYGVVSVKTGKLAGKVINFSPEYEDCKNLAKSKNISLRQIYKAAQK